VKRAQPLLAAEAERWRGAVTRHRALRVVAMGLFGVAAVVLLAHLPLVAEGRLVWYRVIPCLIGLGLSLGAFGANDESVLHSLVVLDRGSALPDAWRAELADEQRRRPGRATSCHLSPRAGLVLPVVAVLAIAGLAWRWWRLSQGVA
jgi:hypothetical protein